MIFADKLIALRKKAGWSQEELADKLGVSRQAVSKWEGMQSVPDLERVIALSKLFGVSTDYLLKDEQEEIETIPGADETDTPLRRVSMEEANAFLKVKEETSKLIAGATVMCILSLVPLILFGAAEEKGWIGENVAAALGLALMFITIAIAVGIFVSCGGKTSPYEYLEKEPIETEYGVSGMVRERQKQMRDSYQTANVIGTCSCVLAVVPLLVGACLTEDALWMGLLFVLMLVLLGLGVMCFIRVGIPWESCLKLLEEGEYSRREKRSGHATISGAYWMLATAVYLAWSFATNDWKNTWIVWPVAGVLFAALRMLMRALRKQER